MKYVLDSCVAFKTLLVEQDSGKAQRLGEEYVMQGVSRAGMCDPGGGSGVVATRLERRPRDQDRGRAAGSRPAFHLRDWYRSAKSLLLISFLYALVIGAAFAMHPLSRVATSRHKALGAWIAQLIELLSRAG